MLSIQQGHRPSRPSSSRRTRLLGLLPLVMVAALMPVGVATAGSSDTGFRDFSYGSSVIAPTGQKPESKLWINDGNWWGVLYNKTTLQFEIYEFDRSSETWTTTGVPVDDRERSEADTLWDGGTGKLYVLSHVVYGLTSPPPDTSIRVMRYSYNGVTKTYNQDFSTAVYGNAVEAAVMDKDTTGMLWLTFTYTDAAGTGREVYVTHSTTGDDSSWVPPYAVPVAHNFLKLDDISTLVAYNGKIGVLWSNQKDYTLDFAYHVDGAGDQAWTKYVLCSYKQCPDDHLNIKSLDSDGTGRLFAVVKTSLNDNPNNPPGSPGIVMYEYNPRNNSWTSTTVWTIADNVTRAITLLDTDNHDVYTFAAEPCCDGGTIRMKKSNYDNLSFPSGLGTPFISVSGEKLNNPTSTKQSVNNSTGLLVLASADNTDYYDHRYIPLGADVTPPTVTAETPAPGATGVDVNANATATFSEPMNSSTINSTTFTLSGPTGRVAATVTYDAVSRTATLDPTSPLVLSATYTATVSGAVTDTAGNPMGTPVTWSFTTGSGLTPITRVATLGTAKSTTSGSTLTLTTTTAAAAGDHVVLAVGYSAKSTTVVSASDSHGDAWRLDINKDTTSAGSSSAILSTHLPSSLPAGSTITVTLSQSVKFRAAIAYEYRGVAVTDTTSAGTGNSTAPSSGSLRTTGTSDLIVGVSMWNSGTITHTAATGVEISELRFGKKRMAVDEQIVNAPGSYADSGTLSAVAVWTDSAASYR